MATRKSFSGNAIPTTLTSDITSTATSIAVAATTGWPDTSVGDFVITVDIGQGSSEEKILISSYTDTQLTVADNGRGYDGTTAQSHTSGATVAHTLDASTVSDLDAFMCDVGTVTPSDSAIGDDAAKGTSTKPAAADHVHGREDFATGETSDSDAGDTASDGTSTSPARADHVHGREDATPAYLPIGGILLWPGSSAPSVDGLTFRICNGSVLSRTTYSDLFDLIGTTYGDGDGSTTFTLPDMRARFPVGYKVNDSDFGTLGGTGGSKSQTLTVSNIPKMTPTITVSDSGHTHSSNKSGNTSYQSIYTDPSASTLQIGTSGSLSITYHGDNTTGSATTGITASSSSVGTASPTAVPTLPPFLAMNWVMRVA